MTKLPIALGLYSVRGTLFTDLKGTLESVAQMGYDGVEFFGPFSALPQAIKSALSANNLKICGWHVPIESLEGINYDATIAYMKAVGVENLVVPYIAAETAQEWEAYGKRMSAIAANLKNDNIRLGYHNHAHEFSTKFDGKTIWDIFFGAMSSDIFPQIDTGNGISGGMNVQDELTKFAGRLRTIHYKPYKSTAPANGHDAMFGQDDQDLESMVTLAEAGGATWHVLEYECENTYSQMGGAREALKAFKKIVC